MERNEQRIIDDLFARLREAERRSGARDAEAESLIAQHIAAQPGAPYYMAQAIVVQQEALAAAQARLEAVERELAERPAAAGFLSGLFGGGPTATRPSPTPSPASLHPQPAPDRPAGAGFLGGAMQTAMGVAGGILVANALTGLMPSDKAAAGEPAPEELGAEEGLPEVEDEFGTDFDFGGDEF